jgi:IS30 family transposase
MNEFDKTVITMYNENNQSTYEIAKALDTYPNKIRRTLKRHGYDLKDRSEAQRVALETGRSTHPTAGKQRTKEERIAISSSLVGYWDNMSDKERGTRVKLAKDNWNKMSDKQNADSSRKIGN